MGLARGSGPYPVTDAKQVSHWLIAYASAVEVAAFMEGADPSPVIKLALDVFWINPNKLRGDLKKAWKENGVL